MTDNSLRTLGLWYQMLPGKALLQAETRALSAWLPGLKGEHLVMLGGPSDMSMVAASPIAFKLRCASSVGQRSFSPQVVCDPSALPLLPGSVDVMVVAHALESIPNPHALLADIYEALRPGGVAIFLCFNRFSLWGIKRYLRRKEGFPWHNRFFSASQLTLLLERHCLSVEHMDYAYYGSSSSLAKKHARWRTLPAVLPFFLETAGASLIAVTQKIAEVGAVKDRLVRTEKNAFTSKVKQPCASFGAHDDAV